MAPDRPRVFQSTRLREARRGQRIDDARLPVFQSTRLREARHLHQGSRVYIAGFQSTRLREARRHSPPPLRRATPGFNPRACVRRDREAERMMREHNTFQSTRLREARRGSFISPYFWHASFNPRACVRRDHVPPPVHRGEGVSIHAPA